MSKIFSFGHTGDWHLGVTRNLTPGSTEYMERMEAVFDEMMQKTHELKLDFLLVCGDLFDGKNTTIPEFLFAHRLFSQLGQMLIVISSDGNHDELEKGKFQGEYLRMLQQQGINSIPNVHFISKPKVVTIYPRGMELKILVVPWTGIKDQDEFDKLIMDNLEPGVEIVMLHECFKGSVANNGKRFPSGVEVPDIPGIKYFACGDIHIPQQINLRHAWFSGSPMQYKFDDDPKKGFLIVEKHDDLPDYKVRFERLHCPIELKTVQDPKDVDPDAPIWYSLHCRADQIPLTRPPNLKKIEPQPIKVEMPEALPGEVNDSVQPNQVRIDYAEGIDQVMGELGYDPAQITAEQEQIRQLVRA